MRSRIQPPVPDLEIVHEEVHTWHIENYRALANRERGPKFDCGGNPWYGPFGSDGCGIPSFQNTDGYLRRILLFPRGNNVDNASMYLEQGHEDDEKPAEAGMHAYNLR